MWVKRSLAVYLISAAFLLLAIGCAKEKMALPPPPPPPPGIIGEDDDRLQVSLFKGDQAVLSNQDIEKILGGHLVLTDRHRLAVLRLNRQVSWSEELADLETQNSERFLQELRTSSQLTQVRYMPTLLIPEKQTVPYLREAAARFQADLLLVYTSRVQTFRQNRLIGSDEVRARCLVDAVLLDVRTGIVVDSTQRAEMVSAKKTQGDLNFEETVAKAEANSSGKALVKVADAIVAYLNESASPEVKKSSAQ